MLVFSLILAMLELTACRSIALKTVFVPIKLLKFFALLDDMTFISPCFSTCGKADYEAERRRGLLFETLAFGDVAELWVSRVLVLFSSLRCHLRCETTGLGRFNGFDFECTGLIMLSFYTS